MSKNAKRIDVFRLQTAPMPTFRLMWMVFSSFFVWFACSPLVPAMQGGFGLQQTLLLIGVLAAASTIRTAAVRLAPPNPNRTQRR